MRNLKTVEYGFDSIEAKGAALIDKVYPSPEAAVSAASEAGATECRVAKRIKTEVQELYAFADGMQYKTIRTKYSDWMSLSHVTLR